MCSTRKPNNKNERTWNQGVFIGLAAGVLTLVAAACGSDSPESGEAPVAAITAISAPTTTEPVATTVEDHSATDVAAPTTTQPIGTAVEEDSATAISAPTTTEPVATTVEDHSATDVADELRAVADEYLRSYEDRDSEAFLAIVTDDYRFVDDRGQVSPGDQARDIGRVLDQIDWGVELLSEYVTTGTAPYTVEFDNRITANIYPSAGRVGTSTLTIVDDDGTFNVSRHVYRGESLAPPS